MVHSPTKRQKAANAATAAAKEAELAERVELNMNELVKLSDEKLNIATQASPDRGGLGACMQVRVAAHKWWCGWARLRRRCCMHFPGPPTPLRPLPQPPSPSPPPKQIYDYIDRHITKLDKDCKAFDAGGWGSTWERGRGVE